MGSELNNFQVTRYAELFRGILRIGGISQENSKKKKDENIFHKDTNYRKDTVSYPQSVTFVFFNMSTLTITTIQSALHWEDKQANLVMFEKKIMGIAEKTEIVVLPEM